MCHFSSLHSQCVSDKFLVKIVTPLGPAPKERWTDFNFLQNKALGDLARERGLRQ